MLLLASGLAGCATEGQNTTGVPWTRKKDWEGGFGGMAGTAPKY